jgi:hypothetical protein
MGKRGKNTLVVGKVMLQKFGLALLVKVGIPSFRESGGSTLRGNMGAKRIYVVCVHGPFATLGGKGEEEYP